MFDAPLFGHSRLLWQRGEPMFTESPREVGVQLMSPTLQSLLLPTRSVVLMGHSAKDSVHGTPSPPLVHLG